VQGLLALSVHEPGVGVASVPDEGQVMIPAAMKQAPLTESEIAALAPFCAVTVYGVEPVCPEAGTRGPIDGLATMPKSTTTTATLSDFGVNPLDDAVTITL